MTSTLPNHYDGTQAVPIVNFYKPPIPASLLPFCEEVCQTETLDTSIFTGCSAQFLNGCLVIIQTNRDKRLVIDTLKGRLKKFFDVHWVFVFNRAGSQSNTT